MQLSSIAQIRMLPAGCPIEGVQGIVKKVFPAQGSKSGVNAKSGRPWSWDIYQINDGTGDLDIQIWNRPRMQLVGQTMLVGHGDNKDNATLETGDYNGTRTFKVKVTERGVMLVNGQPVAQGSPPAPAPQPQYAQPPIPQPQAQGFYQPPGAAPYQPPPQPAYQPQPIQQERQIYPPPPVPGTGIPVDFRQFVAQGEGEDFVKAGKRRINEVGGMLHECLKAQYHSLNVLSQITGVSFTMADVQAGAATILIQLHKMDAIMCKGFALPSNSPAKAPQPKPQTHPDPDPDGIARMMQEALAQAQRAPETAEDDNVPF